MKRNLLAVSLIGLVMLAPRAALSVTLALEPSSPNVAVGDTVTVDLNISELGDFAPPSLGAFFVEILFDDSILGLGPVTYGSFLGDPADPFETDIVTTVGVGVVGLDEFSFLFDFELDALQPAPFTLATLSFSGLAAGTSALTFGPFDLSDALGMSILDPALQPASIVVSSASAVPEPSTLALMAIGLAGIGFAGGRRLTP